MPDRSSHALGVKFHGNKTMNVPPLVEAADTGPFFHNNAVDTIEEAVHFYTTETFSTDPAFKFVLTNEQINQIGAFLRAINALENIRSSNALGAGRRRASCSRRGRRSGSGSSPTPMTRSRC